MVRLSVTIGLLAYGAVSGAMGCFSSSSPATSGTNNGGTATTGSSGTATGTSGSGSGSGSSGSTAGTSTPGADGGPSTVGTASTGEVVLDDMTKQQSVTLGSWYTYSDRTIPNSEPPIPTPGAAAPPGSVTPKEGDAFFAVTDARGPTLAPAGGTGPMLMPYREALGGGESTWGAGFGMDITSSVPDGGPVAFNTCPNPAADAGHSMIFDTSGASTNVGIPVPFNAVTNHYTGIAFYGISFGTTSASVNVQLDDERTSPWGGSCVVCQNGGKCAAGADGGKECPCSDSYIVSELFPVGEWKRFSFHFTDMTLATANWSTQGLTKGGIDATNLYNLHFQLSTSAGKALGMFDVGVAYVTWLTD